MKFGEEWLRKWINPPISSIHLCNQLIKIGLEVDLLESSPVIFKNIIVGQIFYKKIHPKNKNFFIYIIQFSSFRKQLITNKNINISIGAKVPVALEGSQLSSGFFVRSFLVDSIISEGIFGSFKNLGFDDYNDNPIILSHKCPIGLDFSKHPVLNDSILTFYVPSNRFDLHSIIGIARDIAIVNNIYFPLFKYDPCFSNISPKINVEIKIPNLDIQYVFREIYSISLSNDISFEMKIRLKNCGLLTDNILKNIVNYVYIETGFWFHILDSDKLDRKIFLRYINKFDNLSILKDKNSLLKSDIIVLSNKENIISLENMEYIQYGNIDNNTKNIFLGSICFDPLFLENKKPCDFLFIKNLDYMKYNIHSSVQDYFLEYISNLILYFCKGSVTISKNIYNISRKPYFSFLNLNIKKINNLLGHNFLKKDIFQILNRCYFKYLYLSNIFIITPPYWRTDIKIEEDIISEILRIYGFDKIISCPFASSIYLFNNNFQNISLINLKLNLVSKGYLEIISYSFVDPDMQKFFFPKLKFLKIINPVSVEMSVMRHSLWIGLIQCILYNQNRQYESIRIFESGFCFFRNQNNKSQFSQTEYLSGAISGNINHRVWYSKNRKFDFYDLKGDLESIFQIFGKLDDISFISEKYDGLLFNQSAGIYYLGVYIGRIGVLDPDLCHLFNLKDSVILFEISLKKILFKKNISFQPISDFPNVQRDISVIVSENITVKKIIQVCKDSIKSVFVKIYVYDVYRGTGITLGKKSISICFIFKSMLKTLRDIEVNKYISRCILELKNKLDAIIRK